MSTWGYGVVSTVTTELVKFIQAGSGKYLAKPKRIDLTKCDESGASSG